MMISTTARRSREVAEPERDDGFLDRSDDYSVRRRQSVRRDAADPASGGVEPQVLQRARWIKQVQVSYIPHDDFRSRAARRELLRSPARPTSCSACPTLPRDVSPYVASLYRTQLLNREQEAELFRRMNGLKHLARETQARIDPEAPDIDDLKRFEWLMDEASRVRNMIIEANLRLVFSLARRFAGIDREE
ncbi:MAG: hypothetical protein JJ992_22600, partial [Planctomycetes bacterium]|nr:hypothetical protein [Planctomycetota bacterium]